MKMRDLYSRLLGWKETDFYGYKMVFCLYGGSVNAHPDVIEFVMKNKLDDFRFFVKEIDGLAVAAVFINSSGLFCSLGENFKVLTNCEVIFPSKPGTRMLLPYKSKVISSLNSKNIINTLPALFNKRNVCLAKSDYSVKTNKNRRNEINKLLRLGGEVVKVSEFHPAELCIIYRDLFLARWNNRLSDEYCDLLLDFIGSNKMIFGNVVFFNGKPCAYDLIFKSNSPEWVYFDVPNGGLNPHYNHLSIGSILMWLNIRNAMEYSESQGKEMIFNLGAPTFSYKKRWSNEHMVYRTL